MADHLHSLISSLPIEDQADVAAFMADPGMADPDSLQLLDPVALSRLLDEMGVPVPEDQPEQQAPGVPDPFAASHTGNVMVLETFRGLRNAGGGLVDSAFLTAAFVIAGAAAGKES